MYQTREWPGGVFGGEGVFTGVGHSDQVRLGLKGEKCLKGAEKRLKEAGRRLNQAKAFKGER